MNRFFPRVLTAVLALICLSSLLLAQQPPQRLKIVTSFLPITAHTMSIVGDLAEVKQLVPNGVGPHDFQFKPSDVKKLAAADLFVVNGLGLEEWMDKLVKQVKNPKLEVVVASRNIPTITSGEVLLHEHGSGGGNDHDHHHHDHGDGANPHVWLDPILAQDQVRNILHSLKRADPANAAAYEANANAYIRAIDAVHGEFRDFVGKVRSKNLVTFHDAFPYFARRYEVNYLGFIEAFPEKSPTPQQLKKLVDLMKKQSVQVVFAEVGYSPKILQTIAQETEAKVATLDTVEIGEPEADAYLIRMRSNLESLRKVW